VLTSNRRTARRLWLAILLPGLLLRSLIPLGFMPMFGPGYGVRLVLCAGYAPVPAATAMSADMPMDMPMGVPMDVPAPHHPDGDTRDHSSCPYGASPAFAALPALTSMSLPMPRSAPPLTLAAQIAHFEPAPRTQSPRAPPPPREV
jgi:hypothetical protein